jgi:4-amino-4-deoxy-L-arabinose transferase-like glycosyltransferase
MTTAAPRTLDPARGLERLRLRLAVREGAWVLPATAGVLAFAAVLYIVNLTVSGYANVYYSGAAWAASQSWSAWFMGSIDPANFITVDKPPLATMLIGLSVRLLGLSSAAILLPQALLGVGTVALTMTTVRRTFGAPASIVAGLVTALTPAAVLIFRYNNPDALLTFLLVGAAYALVRALESDRLRWVALAGILVGLAFNTKLLQAYLVLPAFAVTFALCAPGSIKRRVVGLAVAMAAVVAGSAWWVAAMELIPASARAYIGGSTNNSALDLVLGYDGLGRIFGQGAGGGPGGPGGGGGFSGTPGILRLFNSQLGGQIAWLLPASVVGLLAGLAARLRAPRTDLARAGFLMWGLWLAVHAVVFSFMSGTIHSYYVVVMAPAVGALVGGGLAVAWRARARYPWVGAAIGVTLLGSAGIAWMLLERTPDFAPGLGLVILAVTLIVLPILALRPRADRARAQLVAVILGIAVLLAGPAAYAVDTMASAHSGGDASAGPTAASTDGGRGFGGPTGQAPTGMTGGPGVNAVGGFGGGMGVSLDTATIEYLVANQGSAKWIVAVSGASTASEIELSSGKAVMAMGGFTGSDNAPTLERLQALIASGDLRFVSVGGGGSGGQGGSSSISTWVTSACTVVSVSGSTSSVYDCAGAVSGAVTG